MKKNAKTKNGENKKGWSVSLDMSVVKGEIKRKGNKMYSGEKVRRNKLFSLYPVADWSLRNLQNNTISNKEINPSIWKIVNSELKLY